MTAIKVGNCANRTDKYSDQRPVHITPRSLCEGMRTNLGKESFPFHQRNESTIEPLSSFILGILVERADFVRGGGGAKENSVAVRETELLCLEKGSDAQFRAESDNLEMGEIESEYAVSCETGCHEVPAAGKEGQGGSEKGERGGEEGGIARVDEAGHEEIGEREEEKEGVVVHRAETRVAKSMSELSFETDFLSLWVAEARERRETSVMLLRSSVERRRGETNKEERRYETFEFPPKTNNKFRPFPFRASLHRNRQ